MVVFLNVYADSNMLYFSYACVQRATQEQVAKTANWDGTKINTTVATSANAMAKTVNLETEMRLYATVAHLTRDRTALLLVRPEVSATFKI